MAILRELLRGVEVLRTEGNLDQTIAEVRDDSRAVRPGDLFVAVPGRTVDGHDFVGDAAARGARVAVVEREVPFGGTRVVVRRAARALGVLAAHRLGDPAERLTLIGITGTNGKTTTTHIVESILAAAGARAGLLGTIHNRCGQRVWPASLTTPSALELQRLLAEMRDGGATHVVMEVTSIALDQERLAGTSFAVAAFTNLTQDHLDYHGTMEAYRDAKARLFSEGLRPATGVAVALVHEPAGRHMLASAAGPRIACSTIGPADVAVEEARLGMDGIGARLATPRGPLEIRSPLLAAHNLENIVVAVGVAEALGLSQQAIAAGVAALRGVPGRLEPVDALPEVGVLVDYAHTPDALARAIAAVRPLVRGRLVVVFGCGGDRDRTKRPIMGRIAAQAADLVFITSDNPRTEEPRSIVEMIRAGALEVRPDARDVIVEVDRRAAIGQALAAARPGDGILIAGKGHEDYQILGQTRVHFDDREEARAAAGRLRQSKGP